jgi:invasion protein IalB
MKDRIMSAPARTASRALAAFAVMALSAVTSVSLAQQAPQAQPAPPKPAAPKPPPKPAAKPQAQPQQPPAQQQQQQQQQAAPPPAAGDQQQAAQSAEPQLIYSPWVKLCNKDADPKAKRVCVTVKDGRVESGLLVVSVAIIEMDGEQRKLLRMSLPYGVALQHGTRLIVDQAQPATAPYVTCLPPVVPPGGCIADYEANADLIARMKKANLLTVQAIHMNGQAMSPQLDLKDFAKAYDGPPTDPKVFEAQQKKLQDELQKRAEEARKKLEMAQPPAAGTPPAPAPAPAR